MKLLKLFLICVVLSGCSVEGSNNVSPEFDFEGREMKVKTIHECEYLYLYMGGHTGYIFTHKGNCKFCIERNKEK